MATPSYARLARGCGVWLKIVLYRLLNLEAKVGLGKANHPPCRPGNLSVSFETSQRPNPIYCTSFGSTPFSGSNWPRSGKAPALLEVSIIESD